MAGAGNDWLLGLLKTNNINDLIDNFTVSLNPKPVPAKAPPPVPDQPPEQAPAPDPAKAPVQAKDKAPAPDPARKVPPPPFVPTKLRTSTSIKKPELSYDQESQKQEITAYILEIGAKINQLQVSPLSFSNPNQSGQIEKLTQEKAEIYKQISNPDNFEALLKGIEAKRANEAKILAKNKQIEDEARIKASQDLFHKMLNVQEAELTLMKSVNDILQKKEIDKQNEISKKNLLKFLKAQGLLKDLGGKKNGRRSSSVDVIPHKKGVTDVLPEVANFLGARVQENNKILKAIVPEIVSGPLIGDRLLNSQLFRRVSYSAKCLAVTTLALAAIPLIPIAPLIIYALNNSETESLQDAIQTITPELKQSNLPQIEIKQVLHGPSENSILHEVIKGNSNTLINIQDSSPNPAINGDLSKIKDLKKLIRSLEEAQKIETEAEKIEIQGEAIKEIQDKIDVLNTTIGLRRELIKVDENIELVEKVKNEEMELIKKNGGEKYLPAKKDEDKVKVWLAKSSSLSSFSIRRSLSRKLSRSNSLDSEKDKNETEIKEQIEEMNKRYNKMEQALIDKKHEIDNAIKDLSEKKSGIILQTKEEKNVEILKELLNTKETLNPIENQARQNLILNKYNEIVNGGIPSADPMPNSLQPIGGGVLRNATLQKMPSFSSEVEGQLLNDRKENLSKKLDEAQRTKLESIIAESAQRGSTKRGLSAGRANGVAAGR